MKALTCPSCGFRVKPVEIVYRLPSPETEQDAEEGTVVLGGCDPTFGPETVCPNCGLGITRGPGWGPEAADDESAQELRSVREG